MFIIRRYLTPDGRDVTGEWLASLKDRRARPRIQARFDRLEAGNPGDCRSVREGVQELRIDYGPGYRVYFCMMGKTIVLLLCGGDKSSQQSDIEQAIANKKDHEGRQQ